MQLWHLEKETEEEAGERASGQHKFDKVSVNLSRADCLLEESSLGQKWSELAALPGSVVGWAVQKERGLSLKAKVDSSL